MKKLIAFTAIALTIVTGPALPCVWGTNVDTPGAPCPRSGYGYAPQTQWQPTPLPQPQTTYGTMGNQSFSITQWPNGMVTIDR